MRLTYGYEVQDDKDPFVTLIERANDNFSVATVPGAFLVDFFPWLKHFPEWLPGMGFLALAREWAKATQDMIEFPYNYTKQQMVSDSFFILISSVHMCIFRTLALPGLRLFRRAWRMRNL